MTFSANSVFLACLGFCCLVWIQSHGQVADSAQLRKLEIVDDDGQVRMRLGKNPRNGLQGVYLYGPKGQLVTEIGMESDGLPFFMFNTLSGLWAMRIDMKSNGDTALQILSPDGGKARAEMGTGTPVGDEGETESPGAYLLLFDKNGKVIKRP